MTCLHSLDIELLHSALKKISSLFLKTNLTKYVTKYTMPYIQDPAERIKENELHHWLFLDISPKFAEKSEAAITCVVGDPLAKTQISTAVPAV